ncbi:hypothetical protein [uncultured Shewanella sp.]|uniref:hypothetical protein n=1 Tax=uncultured Shewanella sp. TaxID=173975 RepID=UPI00260DF259|nr:hypothetical protein [uncultured Shewanella sp.]
MSTKFSIIVSFCGLICGCTSSYESLYGTVVPFEGGKYQSIVIANDKAMVLRQAAHDLRVFCQQRGDQYYVVESQKTIYRTPDKLETGNPFINAIGDIMVENDNRKHGDAFETMTFFRCKEPKLSS